MNNVYGFPYFAVPPLNSRTASSPNFSNLPIFISVRAVLSSVTAPARDDPSVNLASPLSLASFWISTVLAARGMVPK